MKQWLLTNPRKNINFAVIIQFYDNTFQLSYGVGKYRFNKDTQLFETLQGAKSWYTKNVQNPKEGWEQPKWKQYKENE